MNGNTSLKITVLSEAACLLQCYQEAAKRLDFFVTVNTGASFANILNNGNLCLSL